MIQAVESWLLAFLAATGLSAIVVWVAHAARRPTWTESVLLAIVPLLLIGFLFGLAARMGCWVATW